MEDNGKYIRLFGTIFFTFIGFVVVMLLLMLGLRLIFGILDFIPWFSLFFTLLIICVPAIIFITVYFIYFKHSKGHASAPVKLFSNLMFAIAVGFWIYFWVTDIFIFFKHHYNGIDSYHTYNLAFLAANVGLIFFIGIVQALTTKKEVDWMERHKNREL